MRLHLRLLYCLTLALFCAGSACQQSFNGLKAVCGDSVSRLLPGIPRTLQTPRYTQFVRFLEDFSAQICDLECSEQIERVFESCREEDWDCWQVLFLGGVWGLASLHDQTMTLRSLSIDVLCHCEHDQAVG